MSLNKQERERENKESENRMEFSSNYPGFRFSPTDVELVSHYLKRKIEGSANCDDIIPEVDICKFEPWDLPAKSIIKSDYDWFFFSPIGRKYPHGLQAKRATEVGFWKATGKERGIKSGTNVIGTKRTLVFHLGRAPRGKRTEWMMHEYCMKGNNSDKCQGPFVLCHIRKKQEPASANYDQNCQTESDPISSHTTELQAGTQVHTDQPQAETSTSAENKATGFSSSKQMSSSETLSDGKLDKSELNQEGDDVKEDDCFADIMKDDIVKLDETANYLTRLQSSGVDEEGRSLEHASSGVPHINNLQGTAQRRMRLEMYRSQPKSITASKQGSATTVIQHETINPTESLKSSNFSFVVDNRRLVPIVLTILAMLVFKLTMLVGIKHFSIFRKFWG